MLTTEEIKQIALAHFGKSTLAWLEGSAESFARAIEEKLTKRFLTVTTTEEGEAVLVSWQDEDHRILEILWEKK
jgi:hypothetical protein